MCYLQLKDITLGFAHYFFTLNRFRQLIIKTSFQDTNVEVD